MWLPYRAAADFACLRGTNDTARYRACETIASHVAMTTKCTLRQGKKALF
jgi:hypothetical protein